MSITVRPKAWVNALPRELQNWKKLKIRSMTSFSLPGNPRIHHFSKKFINFRRQLVWINLFVHWINCFLKWIHFYQPLQDLRNYLCSCSTRNSGETDASKLKNLKKGCLSYLNSLESHKRGLFLRNITEKFSMKPWKNRFRNSPMLLIFFLFCNFLDIALTQAFCHE